MGSQSFFLDSEKDVKAVLDSWEWGFGNDCGKEVGFISHHEKEGGLIGNGMRAVIMSEFWEGNVLCPWGRVSFTEDS